jgi:hypothetical protein
VERRHGAQTELWAEPGRCERAKQARKEAKLEALKEAVARRKSGEDPQDDAETHVENDLKTAGEHHGQ